MSNIQLHTADGKYDGEIMLDTFAGGVNILVFGPDGRTPIYGRALDTETARLLATGLRACADALETDPNT